MEVIRATMSSFISFLFTGVASRVLRPKKTANEPTSHHDDGSDDYDDSMSDGVYMLSYYPTPSSLPVFI